MPFNGSGSFSAPSVSGWPASPGAIISSTAVNTVINDIMAGLSAVLPRDGQSAMTGPLNMGAQKITNVLFSEEAAAPNVASAATVDVGAQPGRTFAITGTTTITSFGVANNGVWKLIRFAGAVPLTHSSNLRLPAAASFTANDGDALLALSLGSGIWEVIAYFNRAGPSIVPSFRARVSDSRVTTGLFAGYAVETDDASNFNPTTGHFTPPVDGWYEFTANFFVTGNSGTSYYTGNIQAQYGGIISVVGGIPLEGGKSQYLSLSTGPMYVTTGYGYFAAGLAFTSGSLASGYCEAFSGRYLGA